MSMFSKWFSDRNKKGSSSAEPQRSQHSAVDYCEQGQKMLKEGKLMQAMEYFQAAIEIDKDSLEAWQGLKETYKRKGDFTKISNCDTEIKRIITNSPILTANQSPKANKKKGSALANNTNYSKSSYRITLVCWLVFIVAIAVFLWQVTRVSRWEVWGGLIILPLIGAIGVLMVEVVPLFFVFLFIIRVYYKYKGIIMDVYGGIDIAIFKTNIKYNKKRNNVYSLILLILSSIVIVISPNVETKIHNSFLLNKQKKMIRMVDDAKTIASNSEALECQFPFGLSTDMDVWETYKVLSSNNNIDSTSKDEIKFVYHYVKANGNQEDITVAPKFYDGKLFELQLKCPPEIIDDLHKTFLYAGKSSQYKHYSIPVLMWEIKNWNDNNERLVEVASNDYYIKDNMIVLFSQSDETLLYYHSYFKSSIVYSDARIVSIINNARQLEELKKAREEELKRQEQERQRQITDSIRQLQEKRKRDSLIQVHEKSKQGFGL